MCRKRAEFHLHTTASEDVSTIGVRQILQHAEALGLNTIAFTNLNNIQDWHAVWYCSRWKQPKLKVIYGGEVLHERQDGVGYARMTLLVQHQAGVKDFYKILSSLHDSAGTQILDLSVLAQRREHLLVGSCGYHGALYKAIAEGAPESTLEEIAAFYDYFEIYPGKSQEEKAIHAQIIALADRMGIPVIAASNAHYIAPSDAICREIMHVNGFVASSEPGNLYVYQTDRMLSAFSYLGAKRAEEVVLQNPFNLAERIEDIQPVKYGDFGFILDDAPARVQKLCLDKAGEIYGNPVPEPVLHRIRTELELIQHDSFLSAYLLACSIAKHIRAHGHYGDVHVSAGSSMLVFLLGISQVNPMPPHYTCPRCHYYEENFSAKDGFDLPPKHCPHCKTQLMGDGHNIPHESYLGFHGDKVPYFGLIISDTLWQREFDFLQQLLGPSCVMKAACYCSLPETLIKSCMARYTQETGRAIPPRKQNKIIRRLSNVQYKENRWNGGILFIPADMEIEDFTPFVQKDGGNITHLDYRCLHDALLKIDLMTMPGIHVLEEVSKETGVRWNQIDMHDRETFALIQKADTGDVPALDSNFVRELLLTTQPNAFEELVRIMGFALGRDVWTGNGELLFKQGVSLSEIPANREDIMQDLHRAGVDWKTAYNLMERIRKGKFVQENQTSESAQLLRKETKAMGEWYYTFCRRIYYMSPKAQAVSYALYAYRCAWFKVHYPDAYRKALQSK